MDRPRTHDRRRVLSLALSSTALLAMALLVAWLAVIMATVQGVAGMVAVFPIWIFLGTSWIWLILCLTALVLARRVDRRGLPVALAVVGVIVSIGGAVVILLVPF